MTSRSARDLRKGVRFDHTTGAVDPTWNANVDARIESLKVSPSGQWVYIGGSFQAVQGHAHDKLAKLAASNAAVQSIVYGYNGPGVVGARVFDIAVDPSNEDNVFVALGPKSGSNPPPPAGAGNRFVLFNGTGGERGPTKASSTVTARPSSSSARSCTPASTVAGTATPPSASRA